MANSSPIKFVIQMNISIYKYFVFYLFSLPSLQVSLWITWKPIGVRGKPGGLRDINISIDQPVGRQEGAASRHLFLILSMLNYFEETKWYVHMYFCEDVVNIN